MFLEVGEWRLAFDGSSIDRGGSAGVILYDPKGTCISFSFKLDLLYSNNKV